MYRGGHVGICTLLGVWPNFYVKMQYMKIRWTSDGVSWAWLPAFEALMTSNPNVLRVFLVPPAQLDDSQPVNYRVLVNPGSDPSEVHRAGRDLQLTVTALQPFRRYLLRVQACQTGNCWTFVFRFTINTVELLMQRNKCVF